MRFPVYRILGFCLILMSVPVLAHDCMSFQFIDTALEEGLLSPSDAALQKIRYIFAPDTMNPDFRVEGDQPARCSTFLFHSILQDPVIEESVKAELRHWMNEPFNENRADRSTYFTPGGHFQFTYYTSGSNAVPTGDSDSNGVPDFVEWCGEYMDYSWTEEVDNLGFTAPYVAAGNFYQVSFQNMGDYGYTQIYGGSTRIVLHRNFYGFPGNDDPEGNQKGAAKVTCAHEFKHASQYTCSNWTEGGWVELDATWMEEIAYPVVNDYHTYLAASGSPLSSPHQPLDYGGSGSYEDCIFQLYMSEIYGVEMIVDLWELRDSYPAWPMLTSYHNNLVAWGSTLEDCFGGFSQFNCLTGYFAEAGYGYPDASDMYTRQSWKNYGGLPPSAQSGTLDHLAARYARHHTIDGLPDYPHVIFDGQNGKNFHPMLVIKMNDGTVIFDEVLLDGSTSDGEYTLSQPCSSIDELHLCIANGETVGYGHSFTYDIETATGGGTDAPGIPGWGDLRLHANFPNPFNPSTLVKFELASPQAVTLDLVSPSGRVLRTLIDNVPMGSGMHEFTYDGLDSGANPMASGVYFLRLKGEGRQSQLRKITLLK
ncbi:MAG: hypothetical protein QF492_05665 [Candidatus Krumholzibacteria bacterium]|jgi:hypothetical protein|nr:hypothetical protein [Candidatus Krumholzibacteria bacterium]MDP6669373.1 hypothetical protein [Candidatus Krumholzibacteria bacterium]MDP6797213.1 hypothetical protein [Candidatus Krumholzibacteria bacterium]MDP7022506.1 hypothetical protein [Candidatus Krumholzibacteria bacterium]